MIWLESASLTRTLNFDDRNLLKNADAPLRRPSKFSMHAPGEDRHGPSIGIVSWARNELVIEGQRQGLACSAAFRRWLVHEIKHDGYRIIVRRDGECVRLYSRKAIDWTARLPAIAEGAGRLKAKSFTLERLISERLPDVAIVDLNLHDGEPAYDLINSLHEQGVHVIVMTGYSQVQLAPGKAAAILHKPFGDEQLLAALHRVTKGAT